MQLAPIETSWIAIKDIATTDFDSTLEIVAETGANERYSVAWCDLLASGRRFGRSIVINGHHASIKELPPQRKPLQLQQQTSFNVPIHMPGWLMNRYSMQLFNAIYYRLQKRNSGPRIVDYNSYFYPLDAIKNWNRFYGKKGFIQYQCVLPLKTAREGFKTILQQLQKRCFHSPLAVLKKFGPAGEGLLSFPMEGITMAIDIPHKGPDLFPFLDQLDAIVIAYGGRTYLAKDARMHSDSFKAMYPQLEQWQQIKMHVDPRGIWSSDLSRRLQLGVWR